MRKLKYSNFIYLLFAVGMLLLYLVAFHDMQVAEGIGLYFALRVNGDRLPYDLAADVVRMVFTLLLLVLPCLFTGNKNTGSFLRLLSAWVALMPLVSMADLIPLMDGSRSDVWTVSLRESGIVDAFWRGELEVIRILLLWIPTLCIIMAGIALVDKKVIVNRYKVILAVIFLLVAGMLVFPGLFVVWQFLVLYLILLCSFELWEKLLVCYPQLKLWSWCLFGILYLRGIYRLLELMSVN